MASRRKKEAREWIADYSRTEEGRWLGRILGLEDVEARGRTVRETRRKLLRKLKRRYPDVPPESVKDRIHLEAASRRALRSFRAAERDVEEAERQLRKAGVRAARELHEEMGLSVRDTAGLLGVSSSWVQVLLAEDPG